MAAKKTKLDGVVQAIEAAKTLEQLKMAVGGLKPEERNSKAIAWPVYLATERIVGKVVKPR